jgi:alkyl hydroperoxide reductase subunit AhpF
MIDQKTKDELATQFEALARPVKLTLFTQEQECRFCQEARQLAEELSAISPGITLEVLDFVADGERAKASGVDKIPALIVSGDEDYGLRFFGVPAGYEFTSLVEAVKAAGSEGPVVSPESLAALEGLATPVDIQVFVTPT